MRSLTDVQLYLKTYSYAGTCEGCRSTRQSFSPHYGEGRESRQVPVLNEVELYLHAPSVTEAKGVICRQGADLVFGEACVAFGAGGIGGGPS